MAPDHGRDPRSALGDHAEAAALSTRETLPADHLERVEAWGGAAHALSYVFRPNTVAGVRTVLARARDARASVGLRGAGCSYGDASLNSEQIALDLSRMNRILAWDGESGVIRVEPGVTIQQLWQYVLEDGWWPSVVPGTMFVTLGGAAAMNIHGKNNFCAGTIGDHVREFELLLPGGDIRRCTRDENADLFHAAIGGFGMLGCFVSLTLGLKRVHSGLLTVEAVPAANLETMLEVFLARAPRADYLVGWVDCLARGTSLGRGLVHQANYLPPGTDVAATQTLRVGHQELPTTLLGVMPKSIMWRFMHPFMHRPGVQVINLAKYLLSQRQGQHTFRQSHAGFHFLLDYVPEWKRAYGHGGLIQYQSFIPKEAAARVFRAQLERARARGLPPFLGVLKQHRPDPFLMTHAVDGFSLALDFKVTARNRRKLWALAAELDQIVLDGGGRFYFAKDLTLSHARLGAYLAEDRVQRFLALKRQHDPDTLLQTNLYRRVFVG